MEFSLSHSLEILERTPKVYIALLNGISPEWSDTNEGNNTWNAREIIGHLIHGEKTDWIPRTRLMLSDTENKTFEPFDMSGHHQIIRGKGIDELLSEFAQLRAENISTLKSFELNDEKLNKKGIHPELGEVTLKQHLSTWTTHDLGHMHQVTRVMVKQYKDAIGPWIKYSGILSKSK